MPKEAYYGIYDEGERKFPMTGYPPHQQIIRALGYVIKAAAIHIACIHLSNSLIDVLDHLITEFI